MQEENEFYVEQSEDDKGEEKINTKETKLRGLKNKLQILKIYLR